MAGSPCNVWERDVRIRGPGVLGVGDLYVAVGNSSRGGAKVGHRQQPQALRFLLVMNDPRLYLCDRLDSHYKRETGIAQQRSHRWFINTYS